MRAVCRVCKKTRRLRQDGKIMLHGTCPGGGRKPKKARVKKVKTKTFVAVILDDSISMSHLRQGAVSAFNALIEPLAPDYKTSFYKFSTKVDLIYRNKRAEPITFSSYHANGGSTALWDAMGTAIEGFKDDGTSSYLVILITDGWENSSQHYTALQIKNLIVSRQATDRWTFAISCPVGRAKDLSWKLDIPMGNFEEWEQTDLGIKDMGTSNARSVTSYTAARATGQRSVKNFYVDIGKQKPKSITKQLEEITKDRFRRLKTTKACKIRPFIESKKLTFKAGCAFYQLQKPEKVQVSKEIVLERKDNGKFYGGPAVRPVLGISGEGRVKPGNLGEFNVWIQSTSNNRNLLAKMELLFDKSL